MELGMKFDMSIGRDRLQFTVNEWQGKVGYDLRRFYQDQATEEYKPTGKGFRLSAEQLVELHEKLTPFIAELKGNVTTEEVVEEEPTTRPIEVAEAVTA